MNYNDIYKIPNISELDNLAYRLYWNDNRTCFEGNVNFLKNRIKYIKYYDSANLYLRKEKIKKLSKI